MELQLEKTDSTDQKKKMKGHQKTEDSHLKQMEDLVKLKCKNYKDRLAKRVVVKGQAGSGKSSLFAKLAYDWSQGDALKEFELVFLLRLSELKKGTSVVDAIDKHIIKLDQSVKDNLKTYIKQNSSSLLFFMDGWDETDLDLEVNCAEADASDDLTIEKILLNEVLLASCVILSTRPHKHVKSQHEYVSVSLKGFSKRNRDEYIKRFFRSKGLENAESLASKFIEKLKQSELLKAICNIPIMLMLTCIACYDTMTGKITFPDTISDLYKQFIKVIWLRYHDKKHPEADESQDLETLTNCLGQTALDGLLSDINIQEDKLVFPEKDLDRTLCKLGLAVGLITKQIQLQGALETSTISFIHKSIEEFYAGTYLADLFKNDRTNFNQKLSLITSWELVLNKLEVLKFCCGISEEQDKSVAAAIIGHVIEKYNEVRNSKNMSDNKRRLCRNDSEHPVHVESYINVGNVRYSKHVNAADCLPILTLLYEAQLKDNTILSSLFSCSVFSKPMSVQINCEASQALMLFHYFLRSVSIAAANIKSIRFCDADSLDLIPDILRYVPHVESLGIKGTGRSSKVTGAIGESVAALTHLSSLTLFQATIDMTDLLSHLSSSRHKSLKHVDFRMTPIGDAISHIGDAISHIGAVMTSHLTCLKLIETNLSESDIEILSTKHLPNTPHLQVLDLSNNAIGESISVLTQHLQHCTAMQALRLNYISLQHNHIETLITFLSSWSVDLSELDLSNNAVGGNITGLSNYLQHCRQMEVLGLVNTQMNEKDKAISVVLPQTLLELDLSANVVGDSLTCLITSLQHCEQLTLLRLEDTYLTDADVVILGQHLHHWCQLSVLSLEDNFDVGNRGLHSVFTHIHHLSKLTVFRISVNIDSSCSALVRDCLHAVGVEIPGGGFTIHIFVRSKEKIRPILDLSEAASQVE